MASMVSISDVGRMSAQTLSAKILAEEQAGIAEPTFAVIDVRDNDYLGGHIRNSLNIPSNQLDAQMPTLARKLKDVPTVIFHCMLSQQRGPSAALKYLRERDEALKKLGGGEAVAGQKVYILEYGFQGWQEVYGTDERLTEGYRKELWEDY